MGNRTECALLQLASDLGASIDDLRAERKALRTFPFTSERKRMTTLLGARPRCGFVSACH